MSKINIFSLGGLNENGKNMYVVEIDKDIFVLDAGLKYADDRMLGVDYIIPNFDYIKNNIKRIKGLFITHGHGIRSKSYRAKLGKWKKQNDRDRYL